MNQTKSSLNYYFLSQDEGNQNPYKTVLNGTYTSPLDKLQEITKSKPAFPSNLTFCHDINKIVEELENVFIISFQTYHSLSNSSETQRSLSIQRKDSDQSSVKGLSGEAHSKGE